MHIKFLNSEREDIKMDAMSDQQPLAVKVNGGKPIPKFGLRDKIGYAFGDVGTTFLMGILASFESIYFTNVLGISPVISGTILSVTTIVGAFTDLAVGRMADKRHLGKKGRFHPWIKSMKWALGLSVLLIYMPFIQSWSMGAKSTYISCASIFYIACLSAFNIPYGSLAAAISSDPDDRTSLSIYRSVGSAIGAGGTGFVLPYLVYTTSKTGQQILSGTRLFYCAIGCFLLAMICYTIMYTLTTERVVVEHKNPVKGGKLAASLFKDRALISFLAAEIVIVLSTSFSSFLTTYMFSTYFQSKQALSIALLFNYANTIVLSFFAKPLASKFGKKKIVSIALFMSSILYLVVYIMQIHNVWLYLVLSFFTTLCFSMFNIMTWAFMTDVIDYHQYVSGMREDGTIYSVNMFGRKVAQTLNSFFSGAILTAIGYKASTTGSLTQSPEVLRGIYALATLVPFVLLMIGALILTFWYPLSKKELEKVSAKLKVVNKTNKE